MCLDEARPESTYSEVAGACCRGAGEPGVFHPAVLNPAESFQCQSHREKDALWADL